MNESIDTPFEGKREDSGVGSIDGKEADVLLEMMANGHPRRHVFGTFFQAGYTQGQYLEDLLPPGASDRAHVQSEVVAELLSLNYEPPTWVRLARRAKLVGVLVAISWLTDDRETAEAFEAVMATAGLSEELTKGQCRFLMRELEAVPEIDRSRPSHVALAFVLHESLKVDS